MTPKVPGLQRTAALAKLSTAAARHRVTRTIPFET